MPFGANGRISPYLCERHIETTSVWVKSLAIEVYSSSYVLYAGGIWKGDILVAHIEELEQMDASEIHAARLHAKGSVDADER